jgi:hypothetical protein
MFNDFMSFIKNSQPVPAFSLAEKDYVYAPPEPGRMEMGDVERSFARLFSTTDGRQVLGYLQAVTFQRALGPASSDDQLRYMEGQRAMVATILRLIDRGKHQ